MTAAITRSFSRRTQGLWPLALLLGLVFSGTSRCRLAGAEEPVRLTLSGHGNTIT